MIKVQFWSTRAYVDYVAELFRLRLKPYIGQMHLPERAGDITAALNDEWTKLWPTIRDTIPPGTTVPITIGAQPPLDSIEMHLTT